MPNQIPTPAQVIQIARISQYLAQNDIDRNLFANGKPVDQKHGLILSLERFGFEWAFARNSADPTLIAVASWVYSLCIPFDQASQNTIVQAMASPPTITGPGNQSVLVGQTASFTVVVTSSIPYTLQWFRNGVLIPGATGLTYSLTNAQLTDSGSVFYAIATSTAGSAQSANGLLTVTAPLVGYYYQGVTDYSTQLLANTDNVVYLGTFPIVSGQPFTVTFPHLVSTEYIVVKYPSTEPTKTVYVNPPPSGPDTGPIPNIALNDNSFGGWKYIFSRTGNPFGVNGVNGQVKFS